eukprot:58877-Chlamydomonas_euryale.AAC.2
MSLACPCTAHHASLDQPMVAATAVCLRCMAMRQVHGGMQAEGGGGKCMGPRRTASTARQYHRCCRRHCYDHRYPQPQIT